MVFFFESGLLWQCVFFGSEFFVGGVSSSWAIGFRFISVSYFFHACSEAYNLEVSLIGGFTNLALTILRRPEATDPRPKHQALAPSVPM